MDGDPLLGALRRWFEIIEKAPIDADNFGPFEAWHHAEQVIFLAEREEALPPGAVAILSELGERLGLPVGAPPPAIASALEQHLGPCPYGDEGLAKITTYLRTQLNAFQSAPARRGPELTGESRAHVHVPQKKLW